MPQKEVRKHLPENLGIIKWYIQQLERKEIQFNDTGSVLVGHVCMRLLIVTQLLICVSTNKYVGNTLK